MAATAARCAHPDNCALDHFRAEVTTSDSTAPRWYTNDVRFHDRDAALEHAQDIADRWELVTRFRTIENDVPRNQAYLPGSEDGTKEDL